MPNLLVTISMQFPSLDRQALAEHLGPITTAAIAAGGITTSVNVQEYEPEADDN